ncbi:hypothetical protein [Aeromicrobium sp.]|uniref:hypothetical protein n=1 Tax=Aeromicrobium sp. TaxID=1871063 RepID=UPI003D6C2D43
MTTPEPVVFDAAPFVILRRTGLYVGLTVASLLIAAGFGVLAVVRENYWLAIPAALLAALGVITLPGAGDSRTPLFVADDHGVRMRHGDSWIGLLWSELGEIRVEPRAGLRHDARVKVISHDGLRIYDAPVGFATNVSPAEAEVQLARRRSAAAY